MANFPYPCIYRIHHSTHSEHKFKQKQDNWAEAGLPICGTLSLRSWMGSKVMFTVEKGALVPEMWISKANVHMQPKWRRCLLFHVFTLPLCHSLFQDTTEKSGSSWGWATLFCLVCEEKCFCLFVSSIIVMIQKIKFKNLVFYVWSLIISNGQWALRMIYLYYMEQTMLPLSPSFTIVLSIPIDVNSMTLFALLSLLHSPLIRWETKAKRQRGIRPEWSRCGGAERQPFWVGVLTNVMCRCHDIRKHENFYFIMKMS